MDAISVQCMPSPILMVAGHFFVFPLIYLKEQSYWLAMIAGHQLWQLVGHRFFLSFFKTAALLMPYKWEVVSCQESHDEKAFACKHMCPFQFSPSWIFLGHRGEKNIKLTQRSMMYEEHKITFKTAELIEFFQKLLHKLPQHFEY